MDSSRAFAVTALFLVTLVAAGPVVHPVDYPAAENDNHALKAQRIAAGLSPEDPFHTPLYHLVTAWAGKIMQDFFAGGRAVSSCFAALFAWASWAAANRAFGARVAGFTLLATVVNWQVIRNGLFVTTDMAYAALAALTLYFLVRFAETPGRNHALAAGASFALAYFARQSAVMILPAVAAALCFAPGISPRRRAGYALAFAGAALAFSIPNFWIMNEWYGNPVTNIHWRNLALRLYASKGAIVDWQYVMRENLPFDGWWSVILHSPQTFLRALAEETHRFFTLNLWRVYGFPASLFVVPLLAAGMVRAVKALDPRSAVMLAFFWSTAGALCAFFTWSRYLLPIIPAGYAFAGHALFGGAPRRASYVAAAAVVLVTAAATAGDVRQFAASHPFEEIAAAKRIETESGGTAVIAGPFSPLDRIVKNPFHHFPPVRPEDTRDPERRAYVARVRSELKRMKADYVILGRSTVTLGLEDWTAGRKLPDYFETYYSDKGVLVLKVLKERL